MTLDYFVQRITAINRAWKVAENDSEPYIGQSLAKQLQEQKSAWQVEFYRTYPKMVWFRADLEDYPDGETYSVRFGDRTVLSSDGDIKWNAEHIPKYLLQKLLTETEFRSATQPKSELCL
ncbi:hypothetical protein AB4342_12545 [Vibrio breoganii]|uniref:hypothetical protein n=1 Tax=Vibrio breoganii TaxID=553239 RepID=UPI000C831837|nr:hypothetical protein [Vibrio breoganii]PMJ44283.1 hypothetical protein BCU21_16040 [Vibrio breoganii]PMK59406.1 hypothetical protein BCT97_06350 [Vibrio breoganii]PMM86751.1 hypothetical protein BCT45_05560 [Vibrio breoganii]PMO29205.1 hypothetical protein BCT14_06525 [Vibrio breoganii]PMO32959.1 hypothetical protein BCT13_08670 [Vibrio breoganii]